MKMFNTLDLQNQKIIQVADPSAATDGANKQYVDNVARGLIIKEAVRVASTANINLSSPGTTIDGVTMAVNDRFLAKDQSTGAQKGIYIFNGSAAAATRALDADSGTELRPGTTVYITEGTVNGDKQFIITSDAAITIGTTDQTWTQFGGGSSNTAGNGISISSGVIAVVPKAAGGLSVDSGGVFIDTSVVARKYSVNVGDGSSTSIVLTHNLGTQDVVVSVKEVATNEGVIVNWVATSTTQVTLTFATAPASNAFRATVVG